MSELAKTKKNNFQKTLFYVCYTLMIAQNMLNRVESIVPVLEVLPKMTIALLVLLCGMNVLKMRRKTAILIFASVLLSSIVAIITSDSTLLTAVLTIVACKNINLERLMKYDICLKTLLLILVVVLYYAGLTAVNLHYRGGEVRQSMGFSNPNTFSSYIMAIVLEFLFLRRKKIGLLEVIVTLFSVFVVDYFADSRTQIVCIISALVLLLYKRWRNGKIFESTMIKALVRNVFSIMFLVSIVLVGLFMNSSEFAQNVNKISSGRLTNSALVVEEYGLTIIGNSEIVSQTVNKDGFAFDNSYIYILYVYGVVPTVLIALAMRGYMMYMLKKGDKDNIIIMLIMLISGFMERIFMRPHFNFFLLYFSYMLCGDDITLLIGENNEKIRIEGKRDERK